LTDATNAGCAKALFTLGANDPNAIYRQWRPPGKAVARSRSAMRYEAEFACLVGCCADNASSVDAANDFGFASQFGPIMLLDGCIYASIST
jgi:hypothetical protein